jgi:hypothetical protein
LTLEETPFRLIVRDALVAHIDHDGMEDRADAMRYEPLLHGQRGRQLDLEPFAAGRACLPGAVLGDVDLRVVDRDGVPDDLAALGAGARLAQDAVPLEPIVALVAFQDVAGALGPGALEELGYALEPGVEVGDFVFLGTNHR